MEAESDVKVSEEGFGMVKRWKPCFGSIVWMAETLYDQQHSR